MVSVELVVGYLTLVLVCVTIFVLFCLSCSCHIPLGKCVRCFCDETRRCCRKETKKLTEPETANSRMQRERGEPVLAGRRRAAGADDEPPFAGCLRGIPFVLTCGYCFGAFADSFTTDTQLASSAREARSKKASVVVGQPVFDAVDVVGTEHVVAVSMPLLSVC